MGSTGRRYAAIAPHGLCICESLCASLFGRVAACGGRWPACIRDLSKGMLAAGWLQERAGSVPPDALLPVAGVALRLGVQLNGLLELGYYFRLIAKSGLQHRLQLRLDGRDGLHAGLSRF